MHTEGSSSSASLLSSLTVLLALLSLPRSRASVPTFFVNLDLSPEQRWREVVKYYFDSGMLQSKKVAENRGLSPTMPEEKKAAWLELLKPQIDSEALSEIRALVKLWKEFDTDNFMNYTEDGLISSQHGYEENYPEFCSGLLVATSNGTTIHGRNMDYMLSFEHKGRMIGWPELTSNIIFMRAGEPLYVSVNWPMQVGIHTAMRFNGWSFEQNTRRTGNDAELNMEAADQGGIGFSMFARRVMESVPDYETAVQTLYSQKFMSTHYFIMAGAKPYEAAVLSIDRLGEHLSDSPPLMELSPQQWHIIQTNDDQGKPTLDPRRPMEELTLSLATQAQVSPAWVFQEMHSFPLFNPATVFTTIFVPATNYWKTILPNEDGEGIPATLMLSRDPQKRSFLSREVRRQY